MNRRVATLLAGGLLSIASLAAAPGIAVADPGSSAQPQTYLCNVDGSDSTAVVQTNDIDSASQALPAFLPMQLSSCHLAS